MNAKLNLLVRENKGRQQYEGLRSCLEEILNNRVGLQMPLPDTDRIVQLHEAAYKRAVLARSGTVRYSVSAKESRKLGTLFHCFGISVREESVYFTPKQSEFVGALEVPLSAALLKFQELLELDGDSFQITSKDETNGLFLDWNKDDEATQFELVVWGERWSDAAGECLRSVYTTVSVRATAS